MSNCAQPRLATFVRAFAGVLVALAVAGCNALPSFLTDVGVLVAPEAAERSLVRIATSHSARPLAHELASAYAEIGPDVLPIIDQGSSYVAEEMLHSGKADLAIVGRALTDLRPEAGSWLLALDAVCIVVPAGSRVTSLTSGDLRRLYGGYVLDWADFEAGEGIPDIVTREQGSVMRQVFEGAIMGEGPITTAALVLPNDDATIDHLAANPNAIGYVSRASLDDRVQAVAVDGHLPTADSIRSSGYPLSYLLVLLTSPDPSEMVQRMAAYALSEQARQLIERGYVLPQ